MKAPDWKQVTRHLDALNNAMDGLEAMFPGRKFTLDGHLVGSIGEVIAAYMFALELMPASNLGYDAVGPDGRQVEIKLTQGTRVALRHAPQHLIVLHRPKGERIRVVYNGPGQAVWDRCGKVQKNGQRPITIVRLQGLDARVSGPDRMKQLREAPV